MKEQEDEIPEDWCWNCSCGMFMEGDICCLSCGNYPPWKGPDEEEDEEDDYLNSEDYPDHTWDTYRDWENIEE